MIIYTPYIWLPLISTILLIVIVVYANRFHSVPASLPFRALMWQCALFSLIFTLGMIITEPALSSFLSQLIYLPGAFIAPTILLLAIEYAGHATWVTRRRLIALLIIPVITVVLALSYPLHTLFRYAPQIDTSFGPLTRVTFSRGPWYWAYYGYGSTLTIGSLGILIVALRNPTLHKLNTLLLILGILAPVLGDTLTVLRITPIPGFVWTPMLFACLGVFYGWALLRGQIFAVAPIARGAVMEHIDDLVIVLDNNGRIADFNRAAQTICGITPQAIGAPIETLPTAWRDVFRQHYDAPSSKTEVVISVAQEQHIYDLATSTIKSTLGQPLGQLFILHDVSAYKRAEEQLRKSEERFRAMVEIMPVPLVLTRISDNTYQYVNKLASDLVGLSQDQMIGKQAIDFYVDPSARQTVVETIRQAGAIHNYETLLKRADGSTFWALFSGALIVFHDDPVILAGVIDISERKKMEEALRQSERSYRLLAENMQDVVWNLDTESMRFTYVSPSIEQLQGYKPEELIGQFVYDAALPQQQEGIRAIIHHRRDTFLNDPTQHTQITEMEQPRKDGSTVWAEIVTHYYINPATGGVEVNGVTRDISERKRAEQKLQQINDRLHAQLEEIQELQIQLREQAMRDVLTGLFNRRYMQQILDQCLAHAAREGLRVSVLMIDIDHFKQLNDDHGHKAGDLMLQAMGALLRSHTRQMDTACRYGGEEFVVIMATASIETAVLRADELRQAFGGLRVIYEGEDLRATISIGVATFPTHGGDSDALLRAADQALYMAKATGRNRVCAADASLEAADKLLTTT